MALDDATAAFLAQAADRPPLQVLSPEEARANVAATAEIIEPGPPVHEVQDGSVAAGGGAKIDVRVLRPAEQARGVLVYLHGGGWVVGSIDGFDPVARHLAVRTGCAVVLVEYRLAPEHRYPTAVEDSWAALRWAAEQRERLTGRAGAPLVVAGDSAGGNLAAVLARRARDAGGPELAAQVLVYPVTDADFDTASYTDPDNQLTLTRDTMRWFWDHYAPEAARRREPDAAPLRVPDLRGLAPAVVLTAEQDVLRDEGEHYAERLRAAGVPVELRRCAGQMHGFFQFVGVLPGAAEQIAHIAACLEPRLR